MKSRPIIFSPEMVRAIMHGEKTQTRRPVKYIGLMGYPSGKHGWCENWQRDKIRFEYLFGDYRRFCPYGNVGDLLWVREKWAYVKEKNKDEYFYGADYKGGEKLIWRPSIHMPYSACRLWLKISDVSIEPLQKISEISAKQEGFEASIEVDKLGNKKFTSAKQNFINLWDKLYKDKPEYKFDSNPWLWVVKFETFRRCKN